jgi:hypothetical protein
MIRCVRFSSRLMARAGTISSAPQAKEKDNGHEQICKLKLHEA